MQQLLGQEQSSVRILGISSDDAVQLGQANPDAGLVESSDQLPVQRTQRSIGAGVERTEVIVVGNAAPPLHVGESPRGQGEGGVELERTLEMALGQRPGVALEGGFPSEKLPDASETHPTDIAHEPIRRRELWRDGTHQRHGQRVTERAQVRRCRVQLPNRCLSAGRIVDGEPDAETVSPVLEQPVGEPVHPEVPGCFPLVDSDESSAVSVPPAFDIARRSETEPRKVVEIEPDQVGQSLSQRVFGRTPVGFKGQNGHLARGDTRSFHSRPVECGSVQYPRHDKGGGGDPPPSGSAARLGSIQAIPKTFGIRPTLCSSGRESPAQHSTKPVWYSRPYSDCDRCAGSPLLSCHRFKDHHAQRVQVTARADLASGELFRSGIFRRVESQSGGGISLPAHQTSGHLEIRQHVAITKTEDVCRAKSTVNDTGIVRRTECSQQISTEVCGLGCRESPVDQSLREGLSLEKIADVIAEVSHLAGLVDSYDAGVVQAGQDASLPYKPASNPWLTGQLRLQNLDDHPAPEPDIGSEEHGSTRAGSKFSLYVVARLERASDPNQQILRAHRGHAWKRARDTPRSGA